MTDIATPIGLVGVALVGLAGIIYNGQQAAKTRKESREDAKAIRDEARGVAANIRAEQGKQTSAIADVHELAQAAKTATDGLTSKIVEATAAAAESHGRDTERVIGDARVADVISGGTGATPPPEVGETPNGGSITKTVDTAVAAAVQDVEVVGELEITPKQPRRRAPRKPAK